MNKKEFKELEELSELFDEYIDDEVFKNRPKRYNNLYLRMEKIPDYEYTYVLAYVLSQKNEKVKQLFNKAKYFQKNPEEYCDTLNFTDFQRDAIDLGYSGFLEAKEDSSGSDSFFEIIDSNLTLNDILIFNLDPDVEHIGLWKLVAYLIDTKNLYVCPNNEGADRTLTLMECKLLGKIEAEKQIHDIMKDPHKYAANCKDKHSGKLRLTALSKDMPLEILDEDFLKGLTMIRTQNKIPHVKINYSVPTLKFKYEKTVNVPINLNLNKKELNEYISKIKDDFDRDRNVVKSTLEIFGESLIDAQEPKSKKKNASKKDFADAIYIYDLYKYFENIYEKKSKKDNDYSKYNLHIDVSLASGISDAHNFFLRNSTVKMSKNKKTDELKKSDEVERLYKLMREYIEGERYKELITGSETIEIPSMWDRIPISPIYSISNDELNKKLSNYQKENMD